MRASKHFNRVNPVNRVAAPSTAASLQNAILRSTRFSIIATDENGIIRLFTPGAERLLGYAAADVLNRISASNIHDPQDLAVRAAALSRELDAVIAPGFEALACKALRGIEDQYELTCIRQDGSRFPALISITALRDEGGGLIGYLLIASDHSARKAELELTRVRAEAQEATRAKSDFISHMSHELRSPLNAILGFAQLLECDATPPTASQKENIDHILSAGWTVLELVNEVLDLEQIESGRLGLSLEPVLLSELMLECQMLAEPLARQHGIAMSIGPIAASCWVHANRDRLKQALMTLFSNAIKYNRPAGEVIVDTVVVAPGRVRINVMDTGAGLPPEKLAQLFQPFNRLGRGGGGEEGAGIALVLTQRLVEVMGGKMGVDSTVGRGSLFWIELNLKSDAAHTPGVP